MQLNIPPDNLGELPPPKEDPSFEWKPLPKDLKYAYIDEKHIFPVIISANLSDKEEAKLLDVLWYVANVSIIFDAPCLFYTNFYMFYVHFISYYDIYLD